MTTKPTLTAIRRAAARARWDRPQAETARITATVPADIADKLRAVAKASGRPVAKVVQAIIQDAISQSEVAPVAPAATPFAITADACIVMDAKPQLVRIRFDPDAEAHYEHIAGEWKTPFDAWLHAQTPTILAKLIPALSIDDRAVLSLTFQDLPVIIHAKKGLDD